MRHLVIPDTQLKPGVPIDHLHALGNMIVELQPEKIICLGDWADMPSLSSYDRPGSKQFEGRRYSMDIAFAKFAMEVLLEPLNKYNQAQRRNKKRTYNPEMHMLYGNHEDRITRAINANPTQLEGVIGLEDLEYEEFGWTVHDFLTPVQIDGIVYCHYFVNPLSGRPIAGATISNRLNKLHVSFVHGHQQVFLYGEDKLATGKRIQGLVCGAFYMHDEEYMGVQGNASCWRGVLMLNDVVDGNYDLEQISIAKLLESYL